MSAGVIVPAIVFTLSGVNAQDKAKAQGIAQPHGSASASGSEEVLEDKAAQVGFELLLTRPYVNSEFTDELFSNLWKVWEEPARTEAERATAEERREMTLRRYGLTARPDGTPGGKSQHGMPLQYLRNADNEWVVNCFSCHGGKVAGQIIPGLPNSHFAMQTLWDDVRASRFSTGDFSLKDLAGGVLPMGNSNGTTNAVIFGVLLGARRDIHGDLDMTRPLPDLLLHHDVDAPPWWNVKKKKWMYADGFVSTENHRSLIQFAMGPENSGAKLRSWNRDFEFVMAYIKSLEPPTYPFEIDSELAAQGERHFNQVCAECHGTYGEKETYPNRHVPIEEIGTDRARYDSLTPQHRQAFAESWFADYGRSPVVTEPEGYLAPPLDGVWASAPYFHNGAVPTLWHVMNIQQRPAVWKRTEDGYDTERVGLEVTEFETLPANVTDARVKRTYFDTGLFGKSASGHDFPEQLTPEQKRAVLEYLKTL